MEQFNAAAIGIRENSIDRIIVHGLHGAALLTNLMKRNVPEDLAATAGMDKQNADGGDRKNPAGVHTAVVGMMV